MTIQMLHSPLKMMTSNSLSEHEPYKKNVRMQVAQAWQNKNLPTGGKVGDSQDKPEQSQVNQAMIDAFIESLRTTTDKKELFGLINKQMMSLSKADKDKFLHDITQTLKGSQSSEDQDLLIEKFNPAYSRYFAVNMLNSDLNEQFRASMMKPPSFDGEDDDDEV